MSQQKAKGMSTKDFVDDKAEDSDSDEDDLEIDEEDEYDTKDGFLVEGGEQISLREASRKRMMPFPEDESVQRPRKRLKTLAKKNEKRSESFIVGSSKESHSNRDNFIVDGDGNDDEGQELVDSVFGYSFQELIDYEEKKKKMKHMEDEDEDEDDESKEDIEITKVLNLPMKAKKTNEESKAMEDEESNKDFELQLKKLSKYDHLNQLFTEEELKKKYLTKADEVIKLFDCPERTQLYNKYYDRFKNGRITKENIKEEAKWIYLQMFPPTINEKKQNLGLGEGDFGQKKEKSGLDDDDNDDWTFGKDENERKANQSIDSSGFIQFRKSSMDSTKLETIEWVLKKILIKRVEVSYLLHYKMDNFGAIFNSSDIWRIYDLDREYVAFIERKRMITNLFESKKDQMNPLYLELLKDANTMEELQDFFSFYTHSNEKEKNEDSFDIREDGSEEGDNNKENGRKKKLKLPSTRRKKKGSLYKIAKNKPELKPFLKIFGLSSQEYAENLQQGDTIHTINDWVSEPIQSASEYICTEFLDSKMVLRAARNLFAVDILNEPFIRQRIRDMYDCLCVFSVHPTAKGDQMNPFLRETQLNEEERMLKRIKQFRNVPFHVFEKEKKDKMEAMLSIFKAEKDGFVEIEIPEIDNEHWKTVLGYEQFYLSDQFSNVSKKWNFERTKVIKEMQKLIHEEMKKYLRAKFLKLSKSVVLDKIQKEVESKILDGPFRLGSGEEDDDIDEIMGDTEIKENKLTKHRILSCLPAANPEEDTIFVMLDENGALLDSMKWLQTNRNDLIPQNLLGGTDPSGDGLDRLLTYSPPEEVRKQEEDLKMFLDLHEPDAICVVASNLNAKATASHIQYVLKAFKREKGSDLIPCYYLRDNIFSIYASTKMSEEEFPTYTVRSKIAISAGRYFNDPLMEWCRLFHDDKKSILTISFHMLQKMFTRTDLIQAFERAFVISVNKVGVDLNRVLLNKHLQKSLPFVCGFGFRKALDFCENVSENVVFKREDLLQDMGDCVFRNCCAFLKICSSSDARLKYEEHEFFRLDRTRIHPSDYKYARKICTDALDQPQPKEDELDQHEKHIEKIMESPGVLEELDLDLYAEQLQETEGLKKRSILLLCKEELTQPFQDPRETRRNYNSEELFYAMINEEKESFRIGSIIPVTIVSIHTFKSNNSGMDRPGLIDTSQFSGDSQIKKLVVKTDNGLFGTVDWPKIKDGFGLGMAGGIKESNLEFRVGDSVLGFVESIDFDKESVTFDLRDSRIKANPRGGREDEQDEKERYSSQLQKTRERKRKMNRSKYKTRKDRVNRSISHPLYQNLDYNECRAYLSSRPVGECVVRPSYSRGMSVLCVTYKYYHDKYVNLNIDEEGKTHEKALGKILKFKDYRFSDLDEMIVRLVQDVMDNVEMIRSHDKFVDFDETILGTQKRTEKERDEALKRNAEKRIRNILRNIKRQNKKLIPYRISMNIRIPTTFYIYYLPSNRVLKEPFRVNSEGYKLDNDKHNFSSFEKLIDQFKRIYKVLPSYKKWKTGIITQQHEKMDLTKD